MVVTIVDTRKKKKVKKVDRDGMGRNRGKVCLLVGDKDRENPRTEKAHQKVVTERGNTKRGKGRSEIKNK